MQYKMVKFIALHMRVKQYKSIDEFKISGRYMISGLQR